MTMATLANYNQTYPPPPSPFEMIDLITPPVPADSNLISFGRWCRSAIDHHRDSIVTGQYVIGTGDQHSFGRNTCILQLHIFLPFSDSSVRTLVE